MDESLFLILKNKLSAENIRHYVWNSSFSHLDIEDSSNSTQLLISFIYFSRLFKNWRKNMYLDVNYWKMLSCEFIFEIAINNFLIFFIFQPFFNFGHFPFQYIKMPKSIMMCSFLKKDNFLKEKNINYLP